MDGQESPRDSVIIEQGFPSSTAVAEQRFLHVNSVGDRGLSHGFMATEQKLLHQRPTVEYG